MAAVVICQCVMFFVLHLIAKHRLSCVLCYMIERKREWATTGVEQTPPLTLNGLLSSFSYYFTFLRRVCFHCLVICGKRTSENGMDLTPPRTLISLLSSFSYYIMLLGRVHRFPNWLCCYFHARLPRKWHLYSIFLLFHVFVWVNFPGECVTPPRYIISNEAVVYLFIYLLSCYFRFCMG